MPGTLGVMPLDAESHIAHVDVSLCTVVSAIAFVNKEDAAEKLYHTILTAREVTGSGPIP